MKRVFIFIIALLFISIKSNAENKYIVAEISNIDRPLVSVPISLGFIFKKGQVILKELSSEECVNEIETFIVEEKIGNISGKNFIYYSKGTDKDISLYFCIPMNMWKNLKENTNWTWAKDKGGEILSKDLNDFTEKMKKCGLMHKIDADYLPTPETPVICDKYNEENPIPSKKIKDFY